MTVSQKTPVQAVPLQGGAITVREPALLPWGSFSMAQNVRGKHPGFIKRPGCKKLHTTADGTNKVLSIFQFEKARVTESHLYAQMSDGDVLEATTDPPGVTTGAFGSEVFDGTSGQKPASWAVVNDQLIHSNGKDQHQIYGGNSSYIEKFVVYKGAAAMPSVPQLGEDYSVEVSDGSADTVAVLDSLDTYANHDCCMFMTPVPAKSITITIPKANGNAATVAIGYWKNDYSWATVTLGTDGTATGGATLAVTGGTIDWTLPTDIMPKYAYGQVGYWYQIRVSAALDAEVEISSITYDSAFGDIDNLWNGLPVYAVEVWKEGTTQFSKYSGDYVNLDELPASKKIMIFCADPAEAFYIDVGATPNATGTAITSLKYWDGDSFETVGTTTDESGGLANSGWMSFPRKTDVQPLQFESSQYYAYVYELILDSNLAANTAISIQYAPFFDINDFGRIGSTAAAWADRASYSFDRYPSYIYITEKNKALYLNGDDYGILQAGDGRMNSVLIQKKFHNELLVYQEEKGDDGGCITLFEGYSPSNYGKLLMSSKIGVFNSKCVAVVDGVLTSTATEQKVKTIAFSLSRYGVCATDGQHVAIVSDDIQNYFDPTETECVRRGYESEHWLAYDSAFNCIRIGIVSGASATVPNVFLSLDLADKSWSFDVLAQELSCVTEATAGSGDIIVVQLGGGTDDGFIYQLNTGTNDVDTAIDSYLDIEFTGEGYYTILRELILLAKAQAAGDILLSVTANGITKISAKTLSMIAEVTNQTYRRHRVPMAVEDYHLTVRLRHATVSQEMYLMSLGVKTYAREER